MQKRAAHHVLGRLVGGALVCSFAGCGETPTQILVEVDGNLPSSQIERLDFVLTRAGDEQKVWSCRPGFPYSFAVNPLSGGSTGRLRIHGSAISPAGEVLLESTVEGAFEKGRLLLLPIRFDSECVGVVCAEEQSCVAGSCFRIGDTPLSQLEVTPKLAATDQCGDFEYLGQGGTSIGGSASGNGGKAGDGPLAGSGGNGASAGKAGSAGESGDGGAGGEAGDTGDGIIFAEGFEDADQPLAAWDAVAPSEAAACGENIPGISEAESSDFGATGDRSLKLMVDTLEGGEAGFNLVRRIPTKKAAYYSARFYIESDGDDTPVRDPANPNSYLALFDFFRPAFEPELPCQAREFWNLDLGKFSTVKRGLYLWNDLVPDIQKREVAFAIAEFKSNRWEHIEVRLDYYGPKKRQYELYQNGELKFTVDDLLTIDREPIFWRIGVSAGYLKPSKLVVYVDDVKISTRRVGPH